MAVAGRVNGPRNEHVTFSSFAIEQRDLNKVEEVSSSGTRLSQNHSRNVQQTIRVRCRNELRLSHTTR